MSEFRVRACGAPRNGGDNQPTQRAAGLLGYRARHDSSPVFFAARVSRRPSSDLSNERGVWRAEKARSE
jgi:hypothetical protein